MAVETGGYLLRRASVISGKEVRIHALSASHMVGIAGDSNAAWRNVIHCAMVAFGVHGI